MREDVKVRDHDRKMLLRASGQLQIDVVLLDILTAGKTKREVSWYALLEHIRSRVLDGQQRSRMHRKPVEHHS